jgi:hypothetical protein
MGHSKAWYPMSPNIFSRDRFASTVVIAASIIAAVRLARDPDISRPSPRLTSVIADSVTLAPGDSGSGRA